MLNLHAKCAGHPLDDVRGVQDQIAARGATNRSAAGRAEARWTETRRTYRGKNTDWTGQMPRRSDYSICEVSTPLIFKLVDSEAVFMSLKLTVIHKNICAHFNGSF